MPAPDDPELARFLREELGEGAPAGGDEWRCTTAIWRWRGKDAEFAGWHFLTIDRATADAIAAAAPGRIAAWRSIKVAARIGATEWRTSIFPSTAANGYLLPIKAAVRKAEALVEGDMVTVRLVL